MRLKTATTKIVLQTAWWSTVFVFFFIENGSNKWLIMRSWPLYHNKSMQMQYPKNNEFEQRIFFRLKCEYKNVKVPLLKRNDRIINIQWTANFKKFFTYSRIPLLDSKPMRSKMSIECLSKLTNHCVNWTCACKINQTQRTTN